MHAFVRRTTEAARCLRELTMIFQFTAFCSGIFVYQLPRTMVPWWTRLWMLICLGCSRYRLVKPIPNKPACSIHRNRRSQRVASLLHIERARNLNRNHSTPIKLGSFFFSHKLWMFPLNVFHTRKLEYFITRHKICSTLVFETKYSTNDKHSYFPPTPHERLLKPYVWFLSMTNWIDTFSITR